jgi:predicted secreted protein
MLFKTAIIALFASMALAIPVESESSYPNAMTVRDAQDATVRCSSQDGGFGRSNDLNTCIDQIIANRKFDIPHNFD